eukprot:TRINITY_DN8112_c0_g1_i22.p1 TRINITY_DN8112_c0_g1~~TRINITY_DN8112_c0_g1_i22.p1  ORF type:complete len:152 (-),score=57.63 TRINITY_DN8112_c0_g1_i22:56-511(-)
MQNLYPTLEEWQDESTLPLNPPTTSHEDRKEPLVHTVTEFDTLDGLSIRYGVPKDAIRQANGFSDDCIFIFRTLRIPFSRGQIYSSNVKYDAEALHKKEVMEVMVKILKEEYKTNATKIKGIDKEAKFYLDSANYNLKNACLLYTSPSPRD